MVRISIDKGVTVFKRPGSACWYLDVDRSGRRRKSSLHTTSRETALAIARSLVHKHQSDKRGAVLPVDVPFDKFLTEYQALAKIRNTERTVEVNVKNLDRFRDFAVTTLGKARELKLSEVTPDLINATWRGDKHHGNGIDRPANRHRPEENVPSVKLHRHPSPRAVRKGGGRSTAVNRST